jgi:hypothetical protein
LASALTAASKNAYIYSNVTNHTHDLNPMAITDKTITEIAEYFECGEICFYNTETEEIEHYPTEIDLFGDEPDPWQDVKDKIDQNIGIYQKCEPMESNQSFDVMQHFIPKIDNPELRDKLSEILSRNKPFRNFKFAIDDSGEYRQLWFDHSFEENKVWVKKQLS